jgi:hypothetical protein
MKMGSKVQKLIEMKDKVKQVFTPSPPVEVTPEQRN